MPTSATPFGPPLLLRSLARNWNLLLMRGLFAILFGLLTLTMPGLTMVALLMVFGAYALIDGLLSIFAAIKGGTATPRWWLAIVGVLGIGAGVITFLWPGMTALMLLYIIAFWAISVGVLEILGAVRLRKEIDNEFWLILGGLASLFFGIFLLMRPGAGALAMVKVIGAFALLYGILLVFFSLRVHRQMPAPA